MLGLLAEVPSAVVLASAVRLALRLAVRLARVRLACVWNLTSANKYVTFSLPVARGCPFPFCGSLPPRPAPPQ